MPEHPLSPIFEPKLPIKLAVPDSTPILSVNASIVTGNVAKLEREVNASNKALDTLESGETSKRIFSLENRTIYKPKMYE